MAQPQSRHRDPAPRNLMLRRLLLVGGSAGSGKSTVARSLATQLDAGWLQLDTVWVALKAAAGLGTPAYDELAIPVLDPLPFETLDARVVYALGVG